MTDSPPSILLGEDSPEDVFLIKLAMAEYGIEPDLQVFDDGAVMVAALMDLQRAPDCIILDLNLVGTSGLEILEFIRQRENLAEVPVVILTSSKSPHDSKSSLERGATRYVQKALSLDEFLAIGAIFRELLEGGDSQAIAAS